MGGGSGFASKEEWEAFRGNQALKVETVALKPPIESDSGTYCRTLSAIEPEKGKIHWMQAVAHPQTKRWRVLNICQTNDNAYRVTVAGSLENVTYPQMLTALNGFEKAKYQEGLLNLDDDIGEADYRISAEKDGYHFIKGSTTPQHSPFEKLGQELAEALEKDKLPACDDLSQTLKAMIYKAPENDTIDALEARETSEQKASKNKTTAEILEDNIKKLMAFADSIARKDIHFNKATKTFKLSADQGFSYYDMFFDMERIKKRPTSTRKMRYTADKITVTAYLLSAEAFNMVAFNNMRDIRRQSARDIAKKAKIKISPIEENISQALPHHGQCVNILKRTFPEFHITIAEQRVTKLGNLSSIFSNIADVTQGTVTKSTFRVEYKGIGNSNHIRKFGQKKF